MTHKKLLSAALISLIAVFAQTEISASEQSVGFDCNPVSTPSFILTNTVIPGALLGAITGGSISYMAGTAYDAIVFNGQVQEVLENIIENYFFGDYRTARKIIMLGKILAIIGAKQYWEKPLRNKLMNWMLADIKNADLENNPEATKTIARLTAWVATMTQFNR